MHLCGHITGTAARARPAPGGDHQAHHSKGHQQAGDSSTFHFHSEKKITTQSYNYGLSKVPVQPHTVTLLISETFLKGPKWPILFTTFTVKLTLYKATVSAGLAWSFVIKWDIYCCENSCIAFHLFIKSRKSYYLGSH